MTHPFVYYNGIRRSSTRGWLRRILAVQTVRTRNGVSEELNWAGTEEYNSEIVTTVRAGFQLASRG